jgi:hypothetical protein
MAAEVPSAGERKTGGTKVMLRWVTGCNAVVFENVLEQNALERGSDAIRAKNGRAGMSLSARKNLLIGRGERRFSARSRVRNTAENTRKIDAPVTVSHLFWPNDPRKAPFWLPIWLPISDFLTGKRNQKAKGAPGGSGRPGGAKMLRPKTSLRNFVVKGPLPYPCCGKNTPRYQHS